EEDEIRDDLVTAVQTCALPILMTGFEQFRLQTLWTLPTPRASFIVTSSLRISEMGRADHDDCKSANWSHDGKYVYFDSSAEGEQSGRASCRERWSVVVSIVAWI